MLHVTNGDVAANQLRQAALGGDVLPWRDVLHEGPIPPDLDADALRRVRARWIASQGWTEEDEVFRDFTERDARLAAEQDEIVLWFEPDLYDQLQLLQAVAGCPPDVPISFVLTEPVLGTAVAARLTWLFHHRPTAGRAFFRLCATAWEAVRAPQPDRLDALLPALAPLPTVQTALRRLLAELPALGSGLSATERQALLVLRDGPLAGREAFRAHQAAEPHPFLGDTVFRRVLLRLSTGRRPLVAPAPDTSESSWLDARFALTEGARAVLEGDHDWLPDAPEQRWVGGHEVDGTWRWDAETERCVHAA